MSEKHQERPIEMRPEEFIRHKIYSGDQSAIQRYMAMVLAKPTYLRLFVYELLTTLLGPIPGALGLALRKTFYPKMLGSVGKGVIFGKSITLRHPENIYIGDNVIIDDYSLIDARGGGVKGIRLGNRVMVNRAATLQAKVGEITIDDDSSIGSGASIISQGPIYIGSKVSLAGGVTIAGGRYIVEATEDDLYAKRRQSHGSIEIGKNTRIGMNAIIQDGVKVGEAAIVAPGSVVLANVNDFEVVSGFPARPWRQRAHSKTRDEVQSPSTSLKNATSVEFSDSAKDIAAKIKSWMEETIFVEFDDDGLSDSDSFLQSNVLDSIGFVTLSVWLEKTFSIDVYDDEVSPNNMDNIVKLVAYVQKKIGKE